MELLGLPDIVFYAKETDRSAWPCPAEPSPRLKGFAPQNQVIPELEWSNRRLGQGCHPKPAFGKSRHAQTLVPNLFADPSIEKSPIRIKKSTLAQEALTRAPLSQSNILAPGKTILLYKEKVNSTSYTHSELLQVMQTLDSYTSPDMVCNTPSSGEGCNIIKS